MRINLTLTLGLSLTLAAPSPFTLHLSPFTSHPSTPPLTFTLTLTLSQMDALQALTAVKPALGHAVIELLASNRSSIEFVSARNVLANSPIATRERMLSRLGHTTMIEPASLTFGELRYRFRHAVLIGVYRAQSQTESAQAVEEDATADDEDDESLDSAPTSKVGRIASTLRLGPADGFQIYPEDSLILLADSYNIAASQLWTPSQAETFRHASTQICSAFPAVNPIPGPSYGALPSASTFKPPSQEVSCAVPGDGVEMGGPLHTSTVPTVDAQGQTARMSNGQNSGAARAENLTEGTRDGGEEGLTVILVGWVLGLASLLRALDRLLPAGSEIIVLSAKSVQWRTGQLADQGMSLDGQSLHQPNPKKADTNGILETRQRLEEIIRGIRAMESPEGSQEQVKEDLDQNDAKATECEESARQQEDALRRQQDRGLAHSSLTHLTGHITDLVALEKLPLHRASAVVLCADSGGEQAEEEDTQILDSEVIISASLLRGLLESSAASDCEKRGTPKPPVTLVVELLNGLTRRLLLRQPGLLEPRSAMPTPNQRARRNSLAPTPTSGALSGKFSLPELESKHSSDTAEVRAWGWGGKNSAAPDGFHFIDIVFFHRNYLECAALSICTDSQVSWCRLQTTVEPSPLTRCLLPDVLYSHPLALLPPLYLPPTTHVPTLLFGTSLLLLASCGFPPPSCLLSLLWLFSCFLPTAYRLLTLLMTS